MLAGEGVVKELCAHTQAHSLLAMCLASISEGVSAPSPPPFPPLPYMRQTHFLFEPARA